MLRITYITLAVIVGLGVSTARAQTNGSNASDTRSITGVVKAISASSLTIDRGDVVVALRILPSTRFVGKGLARDLVLRNPEPGSKLTDLVKAGDRVTVRVRPSRTVVDVRLAPQ